MPKNQRKGKKKQAVSLSESRFEETAFFNRTLEALRDLGHYEVQISQVFQRCMQAVAPSIEWVQESAITGMESKVWKILFTQLDPGLLRENVRKLKKMDEDIAPLLFKINTIYSSYQKAFLTFDDKNPLNASILAPLCEAIALRRRIRECLTLVDVKHGLDSATASAEALAHTQTIGIAIKAIHYSLFSNKKIAPDSTAIYFMIAAAMSCAKYIYLQIDPNEFQVFGPRILELIFCLVDYKRLPEVLRPERSDQLDSMEEEKNLLKNIILFTQLFSENNRELPYALNISSYYLEKSLTNSVFFLQHLIHDPEFAQLLTYYFQQIEKIALAYCEITKERLLTITTPSIISVSDMTPIMLDATKRMDAVKKIQILLQTCIDNLSTLQLIKQSGCNEAHISLSHMISNFERPIALMEKAYQMAFEHASKLSNIESDALVASEEKEIAAREDAARAENARIKTRRSAHIYIPIVEETTAPEVFAHPPENPDHQIEREIHALYERCIENPELLPATFQRLMNIFQGDSDFQKIAALMASCDIAIHLAEPLKTHGPQLREKIDWFKTQKFSDSTRAESVRTWYLVNYLFNPGNELGYPRYKPAFKALSMLVPLLNQVPQVLSVWRLRSTGENELIEQLSDYVVGMMLPQMRQLVDKMIDINLMTILKEVEAWKKERSDYIFKRGYTKSQQQHPKREVEGSGIDLSVKGLNEGIRLCGETLEMDTLPQRLGKSIQNIAKLIHVDEKFVKKTPSPPFLAEYYIFPWVDKLKNQASIVFEQFKPYFKQEHCRVVGRVATILSAPNERHDEPNDFDCLIFCTEKEVQRAVEKLKYLRFNENAKPPAFIDNVRLFKKSKETCKDDRIELDIQVVLKIVPEDSLKTEKTIKTLIAADAFNRDLTQHTFYVNANLQAKSPLPNAVDDVKTHKIDVPGLPLERFLHDPSLTLRVLRKLVSERSLCALDGLDEPIISEATEEALRRLPLLAPKIAYYRSYIDYYFRKIAREFTQHDPFQAEELMQVLYNYRIHEIIWGIPHNDFATVKIAFQNILATTFPSSGPPHHYASKKENLAVSPLVAGSLFGAAPAVPTDESQASLVTSAFVDQL